MNKKFKAALVFTTVTSLFATSLTASAGTFTDVSGSETYMKGIEFLAEQGIVNGNPDGTFRPNNTLNRAEMVKIIAEGTVKLNGGDASVFDAYVGANCFADVPTNAWFTKYVCYAKAQGWVSGYTGNLFKPNQAVNFVESLKITFKGFELNYTETSTPWYKDSVEEAGENNYIPPTIASFSAGLKRGEMAEMVSRIIKKDAGEEAYEEYLGEWKDTVVTYESIEDGEDTSSEDDDDDNTGSEVSGEFSADTNYKGPFPAPDGVVLKGTIGANTFKEPTGDGAFQYEYQATFKRSVQCLDETRGVIGSKGAYYDNGWEDGFYIGKAEGEELFPVFNDTPTGSLAGNQYYAEGYREGYSYGYDGLLYVGAKIDCPAAEADASKYDKDGWYKHTGLEDVKTIDALYLPNMLGVGYSSGSTLGSDSVSVSFSSQIDAVEGSEFNENNDPINLHRIDISDVAEDSTVDLETEAADLYDAVVADTQQKYGSTVVFIGDPTIETETYGGNEFTLLTYVVASDGKWLVSSYAFRQDPETKDITTIYFYDSLDVSNEDKDGFNMENTPNVEFVEQFLEKIVFAN